MSDAVALLWVALGGAAGASCRYGIASGAHALSRLPGHAAVLVANVAGCVFIAWGAVRFGEDSVERLLFVTGYCGALTTFSTFSLDNMILFLEKRWGQLLLNVVGSLALGIGATGALVAWWTP
jgi:CrcB protein